METFLGMFIKIIKYLFIVHTHTLFSNALFFSFKVSIEFSHSKTQHNCLLWTFLGLKNILLLVFSNAEEDKFPTEYVTRKLVSVTKCPRFCEACHLHSLKQWEGQLHDFDIVSSLMATQVKWSLKITAKPKSIKQNP